MLYIVGPSGSGKTTLLSMISGILRPDAGTVRVEDTDVWSLRENALADFRLNKIGFVFQDFHLFPPSRRSRTSPSRSSSSGATGTRRCSEAHEVPRGRRASRARAELTPTRLSGGEQQRVAIARAIASGPDLLIFDEPTASLDGDTGRRSSSS